MGTEVLRPQDCLGQILPSTTFHHRRKNYPDTGNWQNNHFNHNIINNNYGYNRKPAQVRTDPKRGFRHQEIPTIPSFDNVKVISKHTKNTTTNNNNQNNEFYNNGNDSILRRGASLDSLNQNIKRDSNNNKIRNKARISSNLAALEVPVRFGFPESMYAGSAFSVSPHPSDLPLPTFFRKQSFDDSAATRDLRRLLRLD